MNKEKVDRRLDLVGTSAGSIISVAAWCALHAPSADVIVSAIAERLRSAATGDSLRCALLHVVHELLLTCAVGGAAEAGRRRVLLAVSRALPPAVAAVRALAAESRGAESRGAESRGAESRGAGAGGAEAGGAGAFEDGLARVVAWWAQLRLFPPEWLAQLGARPAPAAPATASSASSAAVPAQLRHVAGLAERYTEARDAYRRAARDAPESGAEKHAEALRRLEALRAAAEGALDSGAGLATWISAERAAMGESATGAEGAGPGVALEAQSGEEEDVLGSFF